MSKVSFHAFYSTYFGHDTDLLELLLADLRRGSSSSSTERSAIFLAGDSSLDNKYWFADTRPAVNGYERTLEPPQQKCDVAFWLNMEAVRRRADIFALNTAVEATTLNDRAFCRLLPQDAFIRRHITPQDYLIVSVGGNDLALAPVLATVLNIIPLLCCTPIGCIERGVACPPNTHLDCGCFGCGLPGCIVGLCGCPPGLAYFADLFGNRVQNYVERLLGRARPKKVVVCMYYFLDVHGRGSWADCFLQCMCYDVSPARLQAAIRRVFEVATSRIRIEGTEVVAFPLFRVLDGSDTHDYLERVEPSPQGGAKMARGLMDAVLGVNSDFWAASTAPSDSDSLVDCGRQHSGAPEQLEVRR